MNLINKFIIWYIAISSVVFLLGGFILFKSVMHEIDREAHIKLKAWIHNTLDEIKKGTPIEELTANSNIVIEELDYNEPLIPRHESDSIGIFPPNLRGLDRKFTIGASYKVNGKHYHIIVHNIIAEPDEIEKGVRKSLILIFFIQVTLVGIVSLLVSRKILSPFHETIQAIKSFRLKKNTAIKPTNTRTKEFKELNNFLEKMTQKAIDDYKTLKEFSENASHETQTPLAVIRGKLELLLGTGINEEQASYISVIQNSLQKLSSINQSLVLLTKLENQEYEALEKLNFSQTTLNSIASFKELMEMKNISLSEQIDNDVLVYINSFLADILLNNLINNAIRHNIPGGTITVLLTPDNLIIENSGPAPEFPTEELFKRFKKGNHSSESTGLGLSIVKQVCELNNFTIQYNYENNLHRIKINFP